MLDPEPYESGAVDEELSALAPKRTNELAIWMALLLVALVFVLAFYGGQWLAAIGPAQELQGPAVARPPSIVDTLRGWVGGNVGLTSSQPPSMSHLRPAGHLPQMTTPRRPVSPPPPSRLQQPVRPVLPTQRIRP